MVDRIIKLDVVGCFDNINHKLLLGVIQSVLGEENKPVCDLIMRFLTTSILDQKGNVFFKPLERDTSRQPSITSSHEHFSKRTGCKNE